MESYEYHWTYMQWIDLEEYLETSIINRFDLVKNGGYD